MRLEHHWIVIDAPIGLAGRQGVPALWRRRDDVRRRRLGRVLLLLPMLLPLLQLLLQLLLLQEEPLLLPLEMLLLPPLLLELGAPPLGSQ